MVSCISVPAPQSDCVVTTLFRVLSRTPERRDHLIALNTYCLEQRLIEMVKILFFMHLGYKVSLSIFSNY